MTGTGGKILPAFLPASIAGTDSSRELPDPGGLQLTPGIIVVGAIQIGWANNHRGTLRELALPWGYWSWDIICLVDTCMIRAQPCASATSRLPTPAVGT